MQKVCAGLYSGLTTEDADQSKNQEAMRLETGLGSGIGLGESKKKSPAALKVPRRTTLASLTFQKEKIPKCIN